MPGPSQLVGDRSVRDVLVPLLLAVFVIVVTSFLVTVVLEMGQEPGSGDLAKASIEFDAAADSVTVTFTSMSRPETELAVRVRNTTDGSTVGEATIRRVGRSYTFGDLTDGVRYEVVVVARWQDRRSVVAARTDGV